MDKITVKIDMSRMFARYSLLFGIAGLFICFTSFREGMYDGFLFGVIAIALSCLSKKDGQKPAVAKAGIALGIICVVFSVFLYYGFSSFYTYVKDPVLGPEFLKMLGEALSAYGIKLDDFMMMLRSTR